MNYPEKDTFGYRLRKARTERNISQFKLADIAGLAQCQIVKYENNTMLPSVTTLEWLCETLRMKASDLLGF